MRQLLFGQDLQLLYCPSIDTLIEMNLRPWVSSWPSLLWRQGSMEPEWLGSMVQGLLLFWHQDCLEICIGQRVGLGCRVAKPQEVRQPLREVLIQSARLERLLDHIDIGPHQRQFYPLRTYRNFTTIGIKKCWDFNCNALVKIRNHSCRTIFIIIGLATL